MKKLSELYETAYRDAYTPDPNGGPPIMQERQEYQRQIPVKVASGNVRFGNYIMDGVIVRIGTLAVSEVFRHNDGLSIVFTLGLLFAYYAGMEALLGQTLGKMMTGTVVVDEYGQKINFQTAALRTIIRIVPFEPFSFLGNVSRGWHDSWSNTYVMRKDELAVLLEKLNENDDQDRIVNSFVSE